MDKKELPELFDLARQAYIAVGASVGVSHIIEPVSLFGEKEVRNEMSSYIKDPRVLNEILIALSTPKEMSFAFEAELRLKSLRDLPEQERVSAIQKYLQDFSWIKTSYAGRVTISEQDVETEIKTLSQDVSEVEEVGDREALIRKHGLPQSLVSKMDTLAFLTSWQDERKKNILIGVDLTDRILEAISQKVSVDHELLRYALHSELNEGLRDMKDELTRRRAKSFYFCFPEKTKVLTEENCDEALLHIEQSKEETKHDLHGTAASLGTAIGKVRVCVSLASIQNVEEGDILVASMTRPEYLPAMRKAAAFITDEGGITCHAAIVAREMRKPCIIGTKYATKVLKDGDLVEVKGNHGLVTVLERARHD